MTSPLILPAAVAGNASGWTLADYRSETLTTGAAAGGRAQAAGDQLAPDELWLIDHAVVSCTSTTPTTVRIYDTYEQVGNLLDGSDVGNFDVADWPASLQVLPSRALLVVWSGASAGAVGTLNLQLRLLRRT